MSGLQYHPSTSNRHAPWQSSDLRVAKIFRSAEVAETFGLEAKWKCGLSQAHGDFVHDSSVVGSWGHQRTSWRGSLVQSSRKWSKLCRSIVSMLDWRAQGFQVIAHRASTVAHSSAAPNRCATALLCAMPQHFSRRSFFPRTRRFGAGAPWERLRMGYTGPVSLVRGSFT